MPEKDLWDRLRLRPREDSPVAVVGAGGKSSTILRLARDARRRMLRVLISTTTHMRMGDHPSMLCEDPESVRGELEAHAFAVAGKPLGKRFGMPDGLKECVSYADVVLLEADGARMLPLKAPAAHEPAIPAWARSVVGVVGLDCVGRPIWEACHRPWLVAELLDKREDHVLTTEDVFRVLASRDGTCKDVDWRPFRCVLNKADTEERRRAGAEIAEMLADAGILAAMTSCKEGERNIRCLY